MSTTITWYGHSCFSMETTAGTVLVDPFLDSSPVAPVKAADVTADFILLTHGHFDHSSDVVPIAKRTGATVVSNFEISEWVKAQGVSEDKVVGMNTGGGAQLPFGRVKFTHAQHSSMLPDGTYGGVPGGYLVQLPDLRIYFAGDTALMLDMKLIGLGGLDVAVLPIGDLFTMGPDDSVEAVKFLNPRRVIPCHYNTWPPIAQDAAAWADRIRSHTAAEPIVLELGKKFSL